MPVHENISWQGPWLPKGWGPLLCSAETDYLDHSEWGGLGRKRWRQSRQISPTSESPAEPGDWQPFHQRLWAVGAFRHGPAGGKQSHGKDGELTMNRCWPYIFHPCQQCHFVHKATTVETGIRIQPYCGGGGKKTRAFQATLCGKANDFLVFNLCLILLAISVFFLSHYWPCPAFF